MDMSYNGVGKGEISMNQKHKEIYFLITKQIFTSLIYIYIPFRFHFIY